MGCKDLIEVAPPNTSLTSANVFTSDATAVSAVTALYVKISQLDNTSAFGLNPAFTGLALFQGLKADELNTIAPDQPGFGRYYKNALEGQYLDAQSSWSSYYSIIYNTNALIEGLVASTQLTQAVHQQLLGEALFMRAFFYFYLTNLYGDVPLALSTNFSVNTSLTRTLISEVYTRIISDLKRSIDLLSDDYLSGNLISPSNERIRPNLFVAKALLSRVYLYTEDYINAETEASDVINSGLYDVKSVSLNDVFLKNSKETIWALQPMGTLANPGAGQWFILPETGPGSLNPFYLSENLLSAFESADKRKVEWIRSVTPLLGNSYSYSYKYRINDISVPTKEYIVVFRLAEQYLIRAEARVHNGNLSGASEDLNIIRNRAGLPDIIFGGEEAMLEAVLHERRVELFTEWGHRWFDLKRTNMLDKVMPLVSSAKGGTWQSYKALEPIPADELNASPGMIGHQNPGY